MLKELERTRMRLNLVAAFLLCVGVVSCDSDWDEGQSTLSPDKKWFVDLETKSGTNGLTRIRIYDTSVYPALKLKAEPNPGGTPTASFTVPIQFYARAVDLKWNQASTVLRIEQPALNLKPPIYYALDLNSFSFSKVGN
ncbi:MAG TPA: hypothetical protein VGI88_04290 [Verrucomicrobiae bacterium]